MLYVSVHVFSTGTKGGAAVRNVEVVQSIENGYIVSRKLSVKKNRDMPSRTTTKERDGDARKKEEEGMEMDESPPLEGKGNEVEEALLSRRENTCINLITL